MVVDSVGGVTDLLVGCRHGRDEHWGQQWKVLCVRAAAGLGQDLGLGPRQQLRPFSGGLVGLIEPRKQDARYLGRG